jgi:signal transduction histidine kinase
VLAAPGAVEQILDNLLPNALRVAPYGSSAWIDPHRPAPHERRFPHRPAGPVWTELHVVDEGPGLDSS